MKLSRKKSGMDWQSLLIFAGGVLVLIAASRKNQQIQYVVDKVASIIPAGGMPPKQTVLVS